MAVAAQGTHAPARADSGIHTHDNGTDVARELGRIAVAVDSHAAWTNVNSFCVFGLQRRWS
jgi:hypothetical protein